DVIDGDRGGAVAVKDELFDLAAGSKPVTAEIRLEQLPRFERNPQACLGQSLVDQSVHAARIIGIARESHGGLRVLDGLAQRRSLLEVAGFQQDDRVPRRLGEQAGYVLDDAGVVADPFY